MNNTNIDKDYNELNELSPQKIYYNTFTKKTININDFVNDNDKNNIDDNQSFDYDDFEENQSLKFNENITPTEYNINKLPIEVKNTPDEYDMNKISNNDFQEIDNKNKDDDSSEYSLLNYNDFNENKDNYLNKEFKNINNKIDDLDDSVNDLEESVENLDNTIEKNIFNNKLDNEDLDEDEDEDEDEVEDEDEDEDENENEI